MAIRKPPGVCMVAGCLCDAEPTTHYCIAHTQLPSPITRAEATEALNLAVLLAPNHEAQARLSDIFNGMIRAGESWKAIATTMVGAAHDGLRYGNWP